MRKRDDFDDRAAGRGRAVTGERYGVPTASTSARVARALLALHVAGESGILAPERRAKPPMTLDRGTSESERTHEARSLLFR